MAYDNKEKKFTPIYERKVRAGNKRTYFFDIKDMRNNGFSLVITESRRRFDDRGYDRTSIYVFQEDINKFVKGLNEAVDYIKTELLPDYDFDQYDNQYDEVNSNFTPIEKKELEKEINVVVPSTEMSVEENKLNVSDTNQEEIVDKW